MRNKIEEGVGWYGTFAILLAYALVSYDIVIAQSFTYQILNATGALGILYISFKKRAWQPGVLNGVWLVIAITAIINLLK